MQNSITSQSIKLFLYTIYTILISERGAAYFPLFNEESNALKTDHQNTEKF